MSIDLAKQQHPELAPSDPQILQIAKEDFTQAARYSIRNCTNVSCIPTIQI